MQSKYTLLKTRQAKVRFLINISPLLPCISFFVFFLIYGDITKSDMEVHLLMFWFSVFTISPILLIGGLVLYERSIKNHRQKMYTMGTGQVINSSEEHPLFVALKDKHINWKTFITHRVVLFIFALFSAVVAVFASLRSMRAYNQGDFSTCEIKGWK